MSTPGRRPVQWSAPEDGLWVLRVAGVEGGTIDRHGRGYFVTDAFSRYVGDYDNLGTAQSELLHNLGA
ncbi:hypothetical protein [Curtobacterium sp. ISL-83]|uniref:hypothetical protein n=1 Tax=Curtobacterium sp. ISL-83 TaxID=2819145 RepID=UPI001BE65299|nr:hypothetical protein [Curtobacterium sp. ISL-83]MBT2501674.1 hypothetical protein [Curtobacterium sp. ISL-83]